MVTTGAGSQVVLDGDGAVRIVQVFPDDGQARTDAADVALHGFDGRREPGQLGLLLLVDARALVGEPDGVALVQDGDDDLGEAGVDEVLRYFPDDRVGNGSSGELRLFVDLRREVSMYSAVVAGCISVMRGALRRSSYRAMRAMVGT